MQDDQQRGLLLALALSMIVIIGWNYGVRLLYPPPEEVPGETLNDQPIPDAPPAAVPDSPIATAEARPAVPEVAPSAPVPAAVPVVETLVRTDVFELRFSSQGAVAHSAKLPLFASKTAGSDGVVELIPSGAHLPSNSHAFGLQASGFTSLDEAVFTLHEMRPGSPEHVELMQSMDRALALSPSGPAGGYTLGFAPSQLLADVLTEELHARLLQEGVAAALAEALAPLLADVALDKDGIPTPAWKQEVAKNRNALASSHILDYTLPLASGAFLHKLFVISGKHYELTLSIILDNSTAGAPVSLGNGDGYELAWGPGLASSERNAGQDPLETVYLYNKSLKKEALTNGFLGRKKGPNGLPKTIQSPSDASWYGFRRKYFLAAVRPDKQPLAIEFVALTDPDVGGAELLLTVPSLAAPAGEIASDNYHVALGPIHRAELEAVGHDFDLAVNYGFFDLFGKGMVSGLLFFNSMVRNYGIAIIVLTVLVRLGLFPLNQRAYQSMRAMNMLQPKIADIKKHYGDQPQEMNKRTMALYSEYKINPLGGCLPLLFQMPVFFALFNALRSSLELRGAQFLWIQDLSEPDMLASLPFGLSLNLLPILMMAAMLAQQKMSTPPANPNNDPNIEMQRKMMTWMPLMFGFMFDGMP